MKPDMCDSLRGTRMSPTSLRIAVQPATAATSDTPPHHPDFLRGFLGLAGGSVSLAANLRLGSGTAVVVSGAGATGAAAHAFQPLVMFSVLSCSQSCSICSRLLETRISRLSGSLR